MISNILPKQYRDVDLVMVEALQLWLQKLCGQLNSTYTWVSRILRKWGRITGLKAEAENTFEYCSSIFSHKLRIIAASQPCHEPMDL